MYQVIEEQLGRPVCSCISKHTHNGTEELFNVTEPTQGA